nr:RNA-directed DNA polymerase, eukaryota, reverse transcriptase zinc-binding domain protein [Tanacetum cinerariifolium]
MPRGGIENDQFDEMSELLQQVILSQSSDRWTWTANGSGQFFVASVMTGSLATRFDISRRDGNKCPSVNQQVVGSAEYGD